MFVAKSLTKRIIDSVLSALCANKNTCSDKVATRVNISARH